MPLPNITREWRLARESIRIPLSLGRLARLPRGNGQTIWLCPGLGAPEVSMEPVRRVLLRKGYTAEHWGLGANRGNVEAYVDTLGRRLDALDAGQRVFIVGWSLGGVIARELAREHPSKVGGVITYGTPVIGGPSYTAAAFTYSRSERQRIHRLVRARQRTNPIKVPVAAIYTPLDSVVSWPACIDRDTPNIVHYEVRSTHFSMAIDPSVWEVVLNELARMSEL